MCENCHTNTRIILYERTRAEKMLFTWYSFVKDSSITGFMQEIDTIL
jgi:hypothetical protein